MYWSSLKVQLLVYKKHCLQVVLRFLMSPLVSSRLPTSLQRMNLMISSNLLNFLIFAKNHAKLTQKSSVFNYLLDMFLNFYSICSRWSIKRPLLVVVHLKWPKQGFILHCSLILAQLLRNEEEFGDDSVQRSCSQLIDYIIVNVLKPGSAGQSHCAVQKSGCLSELVPRD